MTRRYVASAHPSPFPQRKPVIDLHAFVAQGKIHAAQDAKIRVYEQCMKDLNEAVETREVLVKYFNEHLEVCYREITVSTMIMETNEWKESELRLYLQADYEVMLREKDEVEEELAAYKMKNSVLTYNYETLASESKEENENALYTIKQQEELITRLREPRENAQRSSTMAPSIKEERRQAKKIAKEQAAAERAAQAEVEVLDEEVVIVEGAGAGAGAQPAKKKKRAGTQ